MPTPSRSHQLQGEKMSFRRDYSLCYILNQLPLPGTYAPGTFFVLYEVYANLHGQPKYRGPFLAVGEAGYPSRLTENHRKSTTGCCYPTFFPPNFPDFLPFFFLSFFLPDFPGFFFFSKMWMQTVRDFSGAFKINKFWQNASVSFYKITKTKNLKSQHTQKKI